MACWHRQSVLQALGGQVAGADLPHESLVDELTEHTQGLVQSDGRVVEVGVEQVEVVGSQSPQAAGHLVTDGRVPMTVSDSSQLPPAQNA